MDKKIIKLNFYGLLWTGSMLVIGKGILNVWICLLVGIVSGILFMRECRKVD